MCPTWKSSLVIGGGTCLPFWLFIVAVLCVNLEKVDASLNFECKIQHFMDNLENLPQCPETVNHTNI